MEDFFKFVTFFSARLSGADPDDEELEEVEELERLTSLANQSLWTRLKKMVLDLVERVGFFGILVCASVSICKTYICVCVTTFVQAIYNHLIFYTCIICILFARCCHQN